MMRHDELRGRAGSRESAQGGGHHPVGDGHVVLQPSREEIQEFSYSLAITGFDACEQRPGGMAGGVVLASVPGQKRIACGAHHALFVGEMVLGAGQEGADGWEQGVGRRTRGPGFVEVFPYLIEVPVFRVELGDEYRFGASPMKKPHS